MNRSRARTRIVFALAGKVNHMPATASVPGPSFPAPEASELGVLRAAIRWARDRRIRCEPTAPPVECVASKGKVTWARRSPDSIVDPIGAAILKHQPQAAVLAEAAALALSTSIPCAEGIADGLTGDRPSLSWMGSTAKRLYSPGYLVGVELRIEMSTHVCWAHKIRLPLGEHCPACLAGLV